MGDARKFDRGLIAQDWQARGFSCGLWTDPPGRVWEDFTHDEDELVLVLSGEVEFEFAGQAHRPDPGRELLIPAGTRHTVRNVGETTSCWLFGYRQ